MLQTERIYNLSYVNADLSGFLHHLEKSYINRRVGAYIATVNPEIGYAAAKTAATATCCQQRILFCPTELAS